MRAASPAENAHTGNMHGISGRPGSTRTRKRKQLSGASEPSAHSLQIRQANSRAGFLRAQAGAGASVSRQGQTPPLPPAPTRDQGGWLLFLVGISVTPFAQPWGWRALFLPGTERGANENAPLSSKPLPGRQERVMSFWAHSQQPGVGGWGPPTSLDSSPARPISPQAPQGPTLGKRPGQGRGHSHVTWASQ